MSRLKKSEKLKVYKLMSYSIVFLSNKKLKRKIKHTL